jgi:hypothetical protein
MTSPWPAVQLVQPSRACCGLTKAAQKRRRYVTRATVAVATCVHKGFAKSLDLPFPLDACHTCHVIAKKATDLFRWSFPSEYSFVSEDLRYGKRPAKASSEAQVRLFSDHTVLIPFPAPSAFLRSHLISDTTLSNHTMSQLAITVGSKTLCATLQEVLDHNHHNINCVNLKNLPSRPEVFAVGDTVDVEARMGAGFNLPGGEATVLSRKTGWW